MISLYEKFRRLLLLEIESLHDELELILTALDDRLARHEITEYVRNENVAVLRNELLGLEDFLRDTFDPGAEDGASLEEIVDRTRAYLRRRMNDHEYVPAIYELVNGRIAKIVRYLESTAS